MSDSILYTLESEYGHENLSQDGDLYNYPEEAIQEAARYIDITGNDCKVVEIISKESLKENENYWGLDWEYLNGLEIKINGKEYLPIWAIKACEARG